MKALNPEAVIIGGAVVDIPLAPVDKAVFDAASWPLESISMRVGGDALNESIALRRLGHGPLLVSKLGADAAGDYILRALDEAGVDTAGVVREAGLDTAINIVLVREDGERSFITNRNGSLRRLGPEDVLPAMDLPAFTGAKVACLASLFVSPMLTPENTAPLFERIRAMGIALCADSTRRKNGETVADPPVAAMLSHLDYFFPNLSEAALLTGREDPDAIADALLDCGVRHAVLKMGGQGCLLKSRTERHLVPAFPHARCVDTTGAGDTFAAGFIAGLLEGRSFRDCGRLANAAASLCLEHVGANAAMWTRADVEKRMTAIP